MSPLTPHDHVAGLPAAKRERLRIAAQRVEVATDGAALDALPIDARIVRGGMPPLMFAWPVDEVDTQEILHDVLVGVWPAEGLLLVPEGWLRIVSGVSAWRRHELEAAEALAKAIRQALLGLNADGS